MASQPARRPYWQVYQRADKDWGIRLRGANHEIVMWTEGYESKAGAEQTVRWVKQNAATADGP
jgi:uncharacterized protein YegP (UPF0339 family)